MTLSMQAPAGTSMRNDRITMLEEDAPPGLEAGELPATEALYLREIGALPLLTAKQEVELGREMEKGNFLLRLQREAIREHEFNYEGLARQLLRRLHANLDLLRRSGLFRAYERESDLLVDKGLRQATELSIDSW